MSKNQFTGTATQPQCNRKFCQFNSDQAPVSQTVSNSDSSSTHALKNPVSKKEGKIHTNNHCQLNDRITISSFDKYDGIILNFSFAILKECV